MFPENVSPFKNMEKDLLRNATLSVRVLHLDNSAHVLNSNPKSSRDGIIETARLREVQKANLRSAAFYGEFKVTS